MTKQQTTKRRTAKATTKPAVVKAATKTAKTAKSAQKPTQKSTAKASAKSPQNAAALSKQRIVVAALEQMNVPHRFSDKGGAILVPEQRVHEARLALAGQGLPRSGNVGFELLDKTRFGASEFTEQLSWQRALEGELGNTIQSIHSVQRARVHLALPRESLFLRDRQPPSASVLVTLYPGRDLDAAQVAAIAWLVSSSVPKLQVDRVSVVDQNGRMLSANGSQLDAHHDHQQLVREVEAHTGQRILHVLTPLVGAANVRVQVSAELDFSQREQTAEVYRPNQEPGQAAVRSLQRHDAQQSANPLPAGIPGALTNQPPGPVRAPITAAPGRAGAAGAGANANAAALLPQQHDSTINYEVDRTIRHQKDMPGSIKRLSVAVVLNNVQDTGSGQPIQDKDPQDNAQAAADENDAGANAAPQPLPDAQLAQLTQLVKDAMGYAETRGDSVSIVNSAFVVEPVVKPAFWQDPDARELALQFGRWLLYLLAGVWIWFGLARPWLKQQKQNRETRQANAALAQGGTGIGQPTPTRHDEIARHEENLERARKIAGKDPRAVAMVLRDWMGKNNATH